MLLHSVYWNCLHTGHMGSGIVLRQKEPRAQCTSVRSDNPSEDFILVLNSQGGVGYDMEVCDTPRIW